MCSTVERHHYTSTATACETLHPTVSSDLGAAARRLGDAGEDLQQRGLPRAVAADDPHDLPALDLEGDVAERPEIGVFFWPRIARMRRIILIFLPRRRIRRMTRIIFWFS